MPGCMVFPIKNPRINDTKISVVLNGVNLNMFKPKEKDWVMGSKLAIWDWLLGTLLLSKSVRRLKFGIGSKESNDYTSLFTNLWMPFKNIGKNIIRYFR